MSIKIKELYIPSDKRVICVSDIHGELDLFKNLLAKAGFGADDILILLGDLYLKGSQCHACLQYIIELATKPNVYVLRGNCDWARDSYLSELERLWLDDLPHIITSEKFIFVHAGIEAKPLEEQDARLCMKTDAFLEIATAFDKWIVTGHWPTANYCHEVPCDNPIICREKHIIAIDGGNVVKFFGQLNAFFIQGDDFSFDYVDKFPVKTAKKTHKGQQGSIHITWLDRHFDILEEGVEFSRVRHLPSGKVVDVPTSRIWDDAGRPAISVMATDHWLAVNEGESVSVIEVFSDRVYAKIRGESGWLPLDVIF